MADKNIKKNKRALRRKGRVRGKVSGTMERPRLTVARSLKNVFVQVIDDSKGVTLLSLATNSKSVQSDVSSAGNRTAAAKVIGKKVAELAKEKGIEQVVFDRNQFLYHGRIKALADGAREGGLKF